MKKILFKFLAAFVCLIILSGLNPLLSVSAQNQDMISRENDRRLAETIKPLTNRSSDGLVEQRYADGSASLDVQGRFQNVMLGKLKPNGEPTAGCVASLDEANLFFERDLETGRPLPNDIYRTESLEVIAARHGMSVKEYLFYTNLIAQKEREMLAPSASTITVTNLDGAGEGFNDATAFTPEGGNPGVTRGAARLNLFNFAADIWEAFLDSNVTINVNAQFDPQFCDAGSAVLGSAGAVTFFRDFTNAGLAGTWHHVALANKQRGLDQNGAGAEINTTFNSNVNGSAGCLGGGRFYLGFNNSTPAGTINLLVVVLHELGHGLGFSSIVNGSTGALSLGFPDVYTTSMRDRDTSPFFWNLMSNAQRQASALNTNDVLWDGANVRGASGFLTAGRDAATGRVELFTPNPLQGGSSISHFSNAATTNLLMEPAINLGLPLTLDLTRQQMRDIGWYRDTTADLTPDTITAVTPSGGTLVIGSMATVNWTNNGGFLRNVIIELSTDGGVTFPTVLGSGVANSFASFNFTVPNMTTAQGRIRVREDNFTAPVGMSAANFNILPLLAANVSVSGRVLASNGRAISRARVTLIDEQGNSRTISTNAFGYFMFEEVESGQTYTIQTTAKGFQFQPQVISINEEISGLVITAE